LLVPLAGLFALGLWGLVRNDPYDALKDAWYVVKIALMLSTGYALMSRVRDPHAIYRCAAAVGAITAIWHMLSVFVSAEPGMSLTEVRLLGVNGYLVTAIALALLVGLPRESRRRIFSPSTRLLLGATCLTSLLLSLSRTYWISFAIVLLFLRIRKPWGFVALVAVMAALVVFFGQSGREADDEVLNTAQSSLVDKFVNSITEIAIRDYDDLPSINDRWRGFEAFRATSTYLEYTPVEQLIGGGFGALVELGIPMILNGVPYEAIPMLHNGYLYVLVKFGAIGMFVYLTFFRRLWRLAAPSRMDPFAHPHRRLYYGLIAMTLVDTFAVAGIFNKDLFDSTLLLLGGLAFVLSLKPYRQTDVLGTGSLNQPLASGQLVT
jgi:hypothetical protein